MSAYTHMVFINYATGNREFGYYDEIQARETMQEYEQHFKKHGVAAEVGIAEIVEVNRMNWED